MSNNSFWVLKKQVLLKFQLLFSLVEEAGGGGGGGGGGGRGRRGQSFVRLAYAVICIEIICAHSPRDWNWTKGMATMGL